MKQHHSGRHVRTIDPTVVDSRKNHVRYATKVCPCLFVRYVIRIHVYNYVATQHSLEKNTKDVYNCTRFHFLETKCSQEKLQTYTYDTIDARIICLYVYMFVTSYQWKYRVASLPWKKFSHYFHLPSNGYSFLFW